MASYSTLTDAQLTEILDRFGLCLLGRERMRGGSANSSLLLETDQGKLVLTISDEKHFEEIENLTALLQFLEQQQFHTSRVLSLPGDPDTTVIDFGGRPLYLKRYIEGETSKHPGPSVLLQAGAELARLHATPVLEFLPKQHAYGQEQFASVIGRGLDDDFEAWLAGKQRRLSSSLDRSLPKGLIHGDLFADNLIVHDDRLVAMIDFEEACHACLVFDIGMALVGLCRRNGDLDLPAADRFLEGYRQIRRFQEGETVALQRFTEYAAVATAFWRFRHEKLEHPVPGRKECYREMVQLADCVAAIPESLFVEALFPPGT
jgi:homoserine kinase type II